MIQSFPFLDASASRSTCERVLLNQSRFYRHDPQCQILGRPFYALKDRDPKKIEDHNSFMRNEFPLLLERTLDFFKHHLQEEVICHDSLSYPGFHIIQVPPRSMTMINFHKDEEHKILKEKHPELRLVDSPQLVFTIWLNEENGLKSGLYYFEKENKITTMLSQKRGDFEAHQLFKDMAKLHIYRPHELNLHSGHVHSLYGENSTDKELLRITYQGNLVKTSRGWILFW